jgi:signal peptidase
METENISNNIFLSKSASLREDEDPSLRGGEDLSLRGGEADAAIQNRPISQENAVTGLLRHSVPRNDSVSYRKPRRRVAATIGNILFYLTLVAILIAGLAYGSQNVRSIFGYSMFTALSGSMEREIPEGSLIIVKRVEPESIQIGDDITFFKDANTTVTHRVMNIYEDYEGSGVRGFETKGIENPMADPDIVYADNVIGRVVYHTGNIGVAVTYVKEHIVIVSLLLIGILVLCISLKIVFSGGKKRRPG